ncbi:MAG: HupE/UreJ family protein [Verrucomicrobiae bacterium]|nr:HupE/UreJ family protein [Verrucomicrobiae bacterium]
MHKRIILILASCLITPALAQAHPLHTVHSFPQGFTHPFLGLDHLLVMLAIGLWAVQLGQSALWQLPCAFLASMMAGGFWGSKQIPLPLLEDGILASVILLGLLLMLAKPLPISVSLLIVGISGWMHGYAHGLEIPIGYSGLNYGLGFLLATASLHGIGLMLPLLFGRSILLTRWAGVGILVSGCLIMLGS